jgi:mono/diheme cytochrome c family protein
MLDSRRRPAAILLLLVPGLLLAPAAPGAPATGSSWQSGAQVYAKVCHYCHDAGVGPVLLGRQLPPEYVQLMVRRGLRAMPAFPASFIDDAALADLGRHIQQSAPPSPPAASTPAAGASPRAPAPPAPPPGRTSP